MKKINLGVLNRAGAERRPHKRYDFNCAVCLCVLEISPESAAIMEADGLGVCGACGAILAKLLSGDPVPDNFPGEHRERLVKLHADIEASLAQLKREGRKGIIFDIAT